MFWAAELDFRGALGYLRGFNQVDNNMGGVYHQFQEQKCSRSTHLELIWEIPGDMIYFINGEKIQARVIKIGMRMSERMSEGNFNVKHSDDA